MKKLFSWRRAGGKPVAQPAASPRRAYHAVTIRFSESQACEAVRALSGQAFLSSEAPELPLIGCTDRLNCRCQYRHQSDRRALMRRDSDHGLPGRFYDGVDRRNAPQDRRSSEARGR